MLSSGGNFWACSLVGDSVVLAFGIKDNNHCAPVPAERVLVAQHFKNRGKRTSQARAACVSQMPESLTSSKEFSAASPPQWSKSHLSQKRVSGLHWPQQASLTETLASRDTKPTTQKSARLRVEIQVEPPAQ